MFKEAIDRMPEAIPAGNGLPLRCLPDGRTHAGLSLEATQAAIAHAHAEWPKEACGYFQTTDGVQRYVPCLNVHEKPLDYFAIDDEVWVLAQIAGGVDAVFHSHPQGELHPSQMDTDSQFSSGYPFYVCTLNPRGGYMDFWGWGDQLPPPPLRQRQFRHAVTDCYALYRHFEFMRTGCVLPDMTRPHEWWNDPKQDMFMANLEAQGFTQIAMQDALPGDGVLYAIKQSKVNHCAAYIGDGLILHHLYGKLSKVDHVPLWSKFMVGFYRMKQDASATSRTSPGIPLR